MDGRSKVNNDIRDLGLVVVIIIVFALLSSAQNHREDERRAREYINSDLYSVVQ